MTPWKITQRLASWLDYRVDDGSAIDFATDEFSLMFPISNTVQCRQWKMTQWSRRFHKFHAAADESVAVWCLPCQIQFNASSGRWLNCWLIGWLIGWMMDLQLTWQLSSSVQCLQRETKFNSANRRWLNCWEDDSTKLLIPWVWCCLLQWSTKYILVISWHVLVIGCDQPH